MRYLPDPGLDGRRGLVTGASRGFGRYIALALVEAGADVAVLARDGDALAEVVAEAAELGGTAHAVVADVCDTRGLSGVLDEVVEHLGGLDLLVNNAGTNVQQTALDVTEEAWDAVMDLNLKAAFFTAQAAGRWMVAHGGGRIVNISSQMAEVGFYKRSAYCASKGGLVQLSKVLALEWAPHGVRVNCVGPTFVDSPLAREMFQDPEIAGQVLQRIPIGRLGRMSEVAAAVVYLASEGADLVTGHHLVVDGGWTIQ